METIAVSELIVRFMERLGIETIFGMPGAHILPVYDSLYDASIKSVLVKHEQGAAFMAGGFARASGKIGACITTAGPGATNLVTGIANAYADKQAILIITGETSTHIFGKGGLQESSGEGGSIDQAALFKGITRYHKVVERTDYLVHVLNQAAKILLSPLPGPVLLSFPYNVQKEQVDAHLLDRVHTRAMPRHPRCLPVDALTELIIESRFPVIVAGYGCHLSGAQEAVQALSSSYGIPVTTSLKGKGTIGDDSALSLGCLGVTSDGQAYRYIVEHADLIIFLGAGFNERTSYLWDARLLENRKIIQIDHDAEQLEKVFKADVALHGDIRDALAEIMKNLEAREVSAKNLDHFHTSKQGLPARLSEADQRFSLARKFFFSLAEQFPENALIFDDNIIFAQNYFRVSRHNRYFPNTGISSLGHAIPAAIGARAAVNQPVFAILGDGGFQMCCMEIMTAVNYRLPLNIVVFNNATMSLIRKNQAQLYDSRFIDCDFVNPDFGLMAQSFGIRHRKITTEQDIDALFVECDLIREINLIEIMLDRDAYPDYRSGR
ncbi:MAG: thiamine pyrophosphate-binding protein [Sulfuricellaceae bacterium]|nr:thiamine pyrophosphate-binding protein [Sulfuricellaceae bacterium]